MAQLVDKGALTWTTIEFHDDDQNLLATTNQTPLDLTYVIASFDQSFSQHFSESTFGVSIPFVYFGFDISARAAADLSINLKVNPGALGIDYTIDVRDIASQGNVGAVTDYGVLAAFQNTAVTWNTVYRSTGGDLRPDNAGTANHASVDFHYLVDIGINNFKIGIDYYVGEFGAGPFTIFDPPALEYTEELLADNAGGGPTSTDPESVFKITMDAQPLPTFGATTHAPMGDGVLPGLQLFGESGDFATASFDVAKFLGQLLGVELSGSYKIVGDKLVFNYTILSVNLEASLKVGQTITFTPSGVGVDIQTSVLDLEGNRGPGDYNGEHLTGMLGDTFTLDAPEMGAGVIHADVNYTMYGTLTSDADFIATAGVNIQALAVSLHNTILKDFDIGVGPLVDIDIPDGGITLGSVDAYNHSVNLAITGTHQEFNFYFERDVQGTPGPDDLEPTDNQTGIMYGYGGDDVYTGNPNNPNLITVRGGDGADTAYGGEYSEGLYGDTGDDFLIGHGGEDFLVGGSGNDILWGGDGNDLIVGMTGRDLINGGAGDDVISGSDIIYLYGGGTPGLNGADEIYGGDGIDTLLLNRRGSFVGETIDMTDETLHDFHRLADGTTFTGIERLKFGGGMGSDLVATTGDHNDIHGGGGNDFLRTTGHDDTLYGEAGNDFIEFRAGSASLLYGGAGIDHLVMDATASATVINVNFQYILDNDGLLADGSYITGFEEVTFKGSGQDDSVSGTNGNDLLVGNGGDDYLISLGGADTLFGGGGNDTLVSSSYNHQPGFVIDPETFEVTRYGPVADILDGGFGENTAIVDRAYFGTRLEFGLGDSATVSDGTQLLHIQKLEFYGAGVTDIIRGTSGDDIIQGKGGRDRLDGGRGSDTVEGGDGDDLLIAREGELSGDNYFGGAGIDSLELELGDAGEGVLLNLSTAGVSTGVTGLIHFEGFERYSITGTGFADTLTGGDADGDPSSIAVDATGGDVVPFADRLFGGEGDDTLDGRGGRDFVSGGDGNDTLVWSEGGDVLDGGRGIDTLRIFLEPDRGGFIELRPQVTLAPVNGAPDSEGNFDPADTGVDDPSAAPDYSDILNARAYSIEKLWVIGNDQRIEVLGGDYDDIIRGSHDNGDILSGRGGNDLIHGDGGTDSLYGGEGDDTLIDEEGDTTAEGGAGDDFIETFYGSSDLSGGAGGDVIKAHFGLASIYGGDGNDILTKDTLPQNLTYQDPGTDSLYGGAGDDIITSNVKALLDGGEGEDTIVISGGDQYQVIDFTDPQLQTVMNNGTVFSGFETLVFNGGNASEVIYVKEGAHALNGGGGNDYVELSLKSTSGAITGGLVNGVLTVGEATITNFETINLTLGVGNDVLIARTTGVYQPYGGVNLSINGWDGNDRLGGGTLNETLDGGEGAADYAVFQGNRDEYEITVLGEGAFRVRDLVADRDGTDTLYNIEFLQFFNGTVEINAGNIIYGGDEADHISPDGSPPGQPAVTNVNDWLYGRGGDDILDGGQGDDRMYGGLGDDYYIVDSARDQVIEFGDEGYDTVATSVSYTSIGAIERIILTGENSLNATGADNTAEWLFGNGADNVLDGRGGADHLVGRGGNDTYYVDDAGDVVTELQDDGYDKVITTLEDYTLTANVEELELLNASGATATGNGLANTILGGAGADAIFGGAGYDSLIGGAGDDILFGGAATDTDGEYIVGDDGDDELHGTAGVDVLVGSGDDDALYLSKGADYLFGGDGLDTLVIDQSLFSQSDQLRLADFQFDTGAEVAVLDGFVWEMERLDFRGGARGEVVRGATGNDALQGGLGDDALYGGEGDDILEGGKDSDSLYGGLGNDTLIGGGGGGGAVAGDSVYGGEGDDYIVGASLLDDDGRGVLDGGAGSDHIVWRGVQADVTGGTGEDRLTVDRTLLFGADVMDLRLARSGTLTTGDGSHISGFEAFDYRGGLDSETVAVGYEVNHLDGVPLGFENSGFDKAIIDLTGAAERVEAHWGTGADGALQLQFANGMTVTRFDEITIIVGPGGFGITNAAPAGVPTLLISDRNPPRLTVNQAMVDDTGASSSDGISRKGGVEITGFSNIGDHVVLLDNGIEVKSFDVGNGGKYRMLYTLGEGDHALTVHATNAWGEADSGPLAPLVVDQTAPLSAVIDGFTLAGVALTSGAATQHEPETIHGVTSEAFGIVDILRDGVVFRTVVADASGAWSAALSPGVGGVGGIGGGIGPGPGGGDETPQGTFAYTARVSDLAGNSKLSKAATVTVDRTAPDAPAFTSISSDTGVSAVDGVTRDNTLVLRGVGEAGATVTVYQDGVAIGTATAGGTGKWSLDHTAVALADGAYHFTARAADRAGNIGDLSSAFDVVVDTTAMAQLNRVGADGGGLVLNNGYATTHGVTLSGRADAGAAVSITNASGLIGSTTADGSGNWTYHYDAASDGKEVFKAKAVDPAGNAAVSNTFTVNFDTVAPTVEVRTLTSTSIVTRLAGVAEAGGTVSVYEGSNLLTVATVNSLGAWSGQVAKLSDASVHVLRLDAQDKAGNLTSVDVLVGRSVADTLTGGAGGDVLFGGGGADRLNGGAGIDWLNGGAGNDIFVFAAGQANEDHVSDFTAGDRLELIGYGAGAALTHLGGGNWQVSDGVVTDILHLNVTTLGAGDYQFL